MASLHSPKGSDASSTSSSTQRGEMGEQSIFKHPAYIGSLLFSSFTPFSGVCTARQAEQTLIKGDLAVYHLLSADGNDVDTIGLPLLIGHRCVDSPLSSSRVSICSSQLNECHHCTVRMGEHNRYLIDVANVSPPAFATIHQLLDHYATYG